MFRMPKRWDIRIYDINRLLEVYDSSLLNLEPMDIPRPKAHDLNAVIKAPIVEQRDIIKPAYPTLYTTVEILEGE